MMKKTDQHFRVLFIIPVVLFTLTSLSCEGTFTNEQDLEPQIWVEHPAGYQCQPLTFESLNSAVEDLESADIPVSETHVVQLNAVCEACAVCPQSPIYLAKIDSALADSALQLGWEVSQRL